MKLRPGFIYPIVLCLFLWLVASYVSTLPGALFFLTNRSLGYGVAVLPSYIALLVFVWLAVLCFLPRMPWVELISPRHFRLRFLIRTVFISGLIVSVFPLTQFWRNHGIGLNGTPTPSKVRNYEIVQQQIGHFLFSGLQGIIILSLTLLTIALIGYKYGRLSTPIWVALYWLGQATGILFWTPGGARKFYEPYLITASITTLALWLIALWAYTHSYAGIKAFKPLN